MGFALSPSPTRKLLISNQAIRSKMKGEPVNATVASTRTTQLYDRRAEEVTLDEVERVLI
jgi:hypothetical protein